MTVVLPSTRSAKELILRHVGGETVVFDTASGTAHALSPLAARVWELCDGALPVSAAAATLGVDSDAVLDVVATFESAGLLVPVHGRRTFLRRSALVGGGALALTTLAVPAAHAAASGSGTGTQPLFLVDFNTFPTPPNGFATYSFGTTVGPSSGSITVTAGDVQLLAQSFADSMSNYPVPAGAQVLDLDGDSPGSFVTSSFPTTMGATYTVSIIYKGNGANNPSTGQPAPATAFTASAGSGTRTVSGISGTTPRTTTVFSFTATAASSAVTVASGDGNAQGPFPTPNDPYGTLLYSISVS